MSRFLSLLAAVAVALLRAAPAVACDGACAQQLQVQSYVQPLAIQQYYAAPLVQRVVAPQVQAVQQVQVQAYAQPLVTQQVLLNRARFVPQRSRIVQVQRVRPVRSRQVIRARGDVAVEQIQVGY